MVLSKIFSDIRTKDGRTGFILAFENDFLWKFDNEFDYQPWYNNAEYVIRNTSFGEGGPVLKIPKTRAYYVNEFVMRANRTGPEDYKYYGQNGDFIFEARPGRAGLFHALRTGHIKKFNFSICYFSAFVLFRLLSSIQV